MYHRVGSWSHGSFTSKPKTRGSPAGAHARFVTSTYLATAAVSLKMSTGILGAASTSCGRHTWLGLMVDGGQTDTVGDGRGRGGRERATDNGKGWQRSGVIEQPVATFSTGPAIGNKVKP